MNILRPGEAESSSFTLVNNSCVAEVSLNGSEIRSFTFNGIHILLPTARYERADGNKKWTGGAPILFPIAGPGIKDEELGINLPQHGFGRERLWRLVSCTDRTLLVALESDTETLAVYPYKFAAYGYMELEKDRLLYRHRYMNLDTKDLIINPGIHPYFNLAGCSIRDVITNISDFETDKHTWNQRDPLIYPSQEKVELKIPMVGYIEIDMSKNYEYIVIWTTTLNGKVMSLCVEPFARKPDTKIFKEGRGVSVRKGNDVVFEMSIKVKSLSN